MNAHSKLLYAILLIGTMLISGCKNPFIPNFNSGEALFVNDSTVWVTLTLDGQVIFDGNMKPGDIWLKKELTDGTRHTFNAHAVDPRVFNKSGTFDVMTGHTETYGSFTVNKVVHIR